MKPCLVPIFLPYCKTEAVVSSTGGIEVTASLVKLPGVCPQCQQLSDRIHGYYERTLMDLPVSQFRVRIRLQMRRYRCLTPSCRQQTFNQRVPGLFEPYQRATNRLLSSLYHIAQAVGGEAGARLAHKLAMPTSGSTLLRLIRRYPEAPRSEPRVLGVDDWAMRKRRRYGTILVDLERHQVVDLLPDRTAATLTAWLQKHTGVEVVTRDRSLEYALGIGEGAPEALQVADRWHLLKNLQEVTERALHELYPRLKKRLTTGKRYNSSNNGLLRDIYPRGQSDEMARQERRLKRLKRYELIRYLSANGLSNRRIARLLNLSRGTVIRYVRAEAFPERQSGSLRSSILDPYLPYLESRYQSGRTNAHQLWREIVEQGYPGSPSQVRKWMKWRRRRPKNKQLETMETPTAAMLLPSVKELTRLLTQDRNGLTDYEASLLERLRTIPEIALLDSLVGRFQKAVRDRRSDTFDTWLADCRQSQIAALIRFADGLAQDYAAVFAALDLVWSNGQTEGQINRLKLLKRQMYGRAKLDLLRRRVLYQA